MELKKIAGSMITIVTTGALLVGATYAYFSDQGTSSNNVFSAGTLDLQLSNDGNTYANDVTATFTGTNMAPNGSPVSGTLTLKNNGTIDANHVDLKFSDSLVQASGLPGSDATHPMDKYLEVTTLKYNGTDLLPVITDMNGNGIPDLEDLTLQPANDIVNLAGIPAGGTRQLEMAVRLHSTAPNDIQGDSVNLTLTVLLDQGPH